MLSVEEAREIILLQTPSPKIERAPVDERLVGYVLAEDVYAAEPVPAYRASIVDGYAVVASGEHGTRGTFPVAVTSHASSTDLPTLLPGQVARITTGAPLPPGATAVVMVEDTILRKKSPDGREELEIEILTDEIAPGENVREIGSDVAEGDLVMRAGEGVTSIGGELGLLASVGVPSVSIYRKPIVGVLSTGDEIVPHDRPQALRLGEVRDTNRPALLNAIRASGFPAVDLGIASDKAGALETRLRDALSSLHACDLVVTSGGVSMGEFDLLKPTVERALGGTIHFGRVAMKPGKPTTFATVPDIKRAATGEREKRLIFSLPGNPASAVVTFQLFVLPSLHRASGIKPEGLPTVTVTLAADIKPDRTRREYHRAVVNASVDGTLMAVSTGGQRSSRIGSFKGANALLIIEPGSEVVREGSRVPALLMGSVMGDS